MRELKKSFFQTILQLTVLAYFFRQSARFSTGDDLTLSLNQLYNLPAYLTVNSHHPHRNHQSENQDSHLSLVYRTKEASQYLDDIRILNLINRIDHQESSTTNNNTSNLTIPYLIVAPATSFASTSSKDLINLSETRLLLNSIELNWSNQFTKEDIEMDIDLQTIIQQDIDLGIEKSYGYGGYDFGSTSSQSSKDELDFFGFKEQLQESQKNLDILSVNQLFERQQNDVPEGFKLILEEDTGEAVLIVINNNTVPQESPVQPSEYQNFTAPAPSFLNESSAQPTVLVTEQQTYGGLNTPQIQLDPARPPPFLSQASVANILDDLSSQKMNNDQMDGLLFTNETTLIDESWFNSFPSLEENVIETTVQYQPQEQQIINNNQSLLNLNVNRSDEFNQTYFSKLVPYEPMSSSNQDAFRLENQTLFGQSYIDQIIIQEENEEKSGEIKLDESYMAKLSEDFEAFLNNFSTFDNQTSSRLTSSEDYEFEDDEYEEDSETSTDYQHAEYMYLRNDNDAANFKQEAVDYDEYESSLSQQGSSMALAGLIHNHTYLASDSSHSQDPTLHPYSYKNRQLKKKLAAESENMSAAAMNKQQETRDEQLLKANNIQIDLFHVINSSAEELSELINVYRLNKDQVNVIKDIRRRGKNKVAAQICRKRKLDSIDTLREDVDRLRDMKEKLQDDHRQMQNEIREMTIKFDNLYKEATGDSSLNASADDPIAAFIRNLKSQLNMRNDSQNGGATSSLDLAAAKKSSDDASRKKFRK